MQGTFCNSYSPQELEADCGGAVPGTDHRSTSSASQHAHQQLTAQGDDDEATAGGGGRVRCRGGRQLALRREQARHLDRRRVQLAVHLHQEDLPADGPLHLQERDRDARRHLQGRRHPGAAALQAGHPRDAGARLAQEPRLPGRARPLPLLEPPGGGQLQGAPVRRRPVPRRAGHPLGARRGHRQHAGDAGAPLPAQGGRHQREDRQGGQGDRPVRAGVLGQPAAVPGGRLLRRRPLLRVRQRRRHARHPGVRRDRRARLPRGAAQGGEPRLRAPRRALPGAGAQAVRHHRPLLLLPVLQPAVRHQDRVPAPRLRLGPRPGRGRQAGQAGHPRHGQRARHLLPLRGAERDLPLGLGHGVQAREPGPGVPVGHVRAGHARVRRLQARPHARAREQLPGLRAGHRRLRRQPRALPDAGLPLNAPVS